MTERNLIKINVHCFRQKTEKLEFGKTTYHWKAHVKGARTSSGARAAPVARDISQKLN